MYLRPSYHHTTDPKTLMRIVDVMAAKIKDYVAVHPEITHMLATGRSGQALAWPISYKIGLPVAVVKKPGERSHANDIVGTGKLGPYIIVDDLIDSGDTMRHILKTVKAESDNPYLNQNNDPTPLCSAIFLCQNSERDPFHYEGRDIPVIAENVTGY